MVLFAHKHSIFLFQKHSTFYSEKGVLFLIARHEFQKYKKMNFNFSKIFEKINMTMNFFKEIFRGFCLLFRNTYLKQHLWVAASVYFKREVSQRSTYFLGKYYSRKYLNVKIPHSKLFQGSSYFLEGVLIC